MHHPDAHKAGVCLDCKDHPGECSPDHAYQEKLPEEVRAQRKLRASVSAVTGSSLGEILLGMQRMATDDPIEGALYLYASACAINVRGDRHVWNVNYVRRRYDDLKALVDNYQEKHAA